MAEAGVATGKAADGLRQRMDAASPAQKIALMVGLAALIALLVGAFLWSRAPAYRILFTNVPDKDGGAIVQSLQQMNVPYKLESGGAISVPADKVYDVRLKLAAQGLPKAAGVGFELLDNQKFGISQFAEQVNYQRAIEGELARSIETISTVEKARVHLAVPKQTVFLRDQQKPTASIVLTLRPGRALDGDQVAGIMHLVSSSVPELQVKNVTLVDQDGNLLSRNRNRANLDPTQLQYVQQVERSFVERVEAILAPIVGRGNVRAEVTAQLDFAEVEQTSETYRPNASPASAAIRSQQTLEQSGRNVTESAIGVPGALSNQPPGVAAAPLTAQAEPQGGAGAAGSSNNRREATTNYEVDKTIQHVKQPVGSVKRLSAAVVVNFKSGRDEAGKITFVPYSAQEITQINNLVREAIGFNPQRGDSVNVVNAAFADSAPVEPPALQERALTYFKANIADVVKLLLIAIAVLYLLFFIIRPLMKDMGRPQTEGGASLPDLGLDEDESGSLRDVLSRAEKDEDQAKLSAFAELLQQAKEMAKNDPRMVATILREWMTNSEENDANKKN